MTVRLRRAFFLLVAAPSILFVAGGLYIVDRSRSALILEIDRFAAERANQHFQRHRDRLLQTLSVPPAFPPDLLARLGVERQTVYDSTGTAAIIRPPLAPPLPLSPDGARTDAMLAAARRGSRVLDLAAVQGRVAWIAYLPLAGRLTVLQLRPAPDLFEDLRRASGYDIALYHDTLRAIGTGPDWPRGVPQAILDSLASFDGPISFRLQRTEVAAAPLKDFDDWELRGAILVRPAESAPGLSPPPLLPMVALVSAAIVLLALTWSSVSRYRRGFLAAILVPPFLAAVWLAAADTRLSAEASDTLLEQGARLVSNLADPYAESARELAALTGSDIVIMRDDSVIASSIELSAARASALSPPAGRLPTTAGKMAYRVADISGTGRIVLLRSPLENSRKAVLFWLAGLYGFLAVGVMVFGSLRAAARCRLELREAISAWSFITPSLLLLLIFSAAPLIFAFYLSFHEWNLLDPAKPFVGVQHYLDLAGDDLFWNAAKNTVLYSLYVPVTMALALGVALLLNRSIRGVALLRAVFFLPYVTSFVAVSIVWQWMYDPDFGLINWTLGLVGLGPFPWLNSPSTALLALMLMAIWIHIGFQMVIFLAGLQAIPNELYEAAMIDGAGPWRRFRKITLPLLRPTTFFVLVTSVIGSFQVFTFVYVMTEGGPLHATDVIVYHIYQNAWQFLRMGYASAMSWVLFAVIFAITLLQFRLVGRRLTPR